MLPAKNRLSNRKDFQMVFLDGKFFSADSIAIKFAKNSQSVTRIGFSVGKNFSKKAVERNKVRRILREVIHAQLENLQPGFDIIVLYRSSNKNPLPENVKKNFYYIFKKCNLNK